MKRPMVVPGDRGDPATAPSAAALVAAIVLPVIDPFPAHDPTFASLPDFAPFEDPSDYSAKPRLTKVDVARIAIDECVATLAALGALENAVAACKASVVDRLSAASDAENAALGLDRWQHQLSEMSIRAEVAAVLNVTEGVAGKLIEHSATLLRNHPSTLNSLSEGSFSWGHSEIIAEETTTLRSAGIPEPSIAAYEEALLGKAPGCTVQSFRDKARRLREKTHPESIAARSKSAYEHRRIEIQRAQDGMSWLSLNLPAPTVEGIWDQCTFLARAAQGPKESRTLTQLRADIAASLLLGQTLESNGIDTLSITGAATERGIPSDPSTTTKRAGTGHIPSAGTISFPSLDPSGGLRTPEVPDDYSRLFPLLDGNPEPDPGYDGSQPGREFAIPDWQVPLFDTPDYTRLDSPSPDLWAPDPWTSDPPLHGTGLTGARILAPNGSDSGVAQPPPMQEPATARAKSGWSGLPPMPQLAPVVLIPALSLIGASSDPAILEGYGPISVDIAKRLLANAPSFYRAFTDPFTGEPLALSPDTRRVSKKMRIMLRAANEFCTFPGCTTKAVHAEQDHLTPWELGGETTQENLEPLDRRHHLLKHFKDDRTRQGHRRTDQTPERAAMKIRGWTPTMTPSGRPGWTSPAGRYYAPLPTDIDAPSYPKWLAKNLTKRIQDGQGTP
jgi:Domain of unknown function (DUF222)